MTMHADWDRQTDEEDQIDSSQYWAHWLLSIIVCVLVKQ